MVNKAASALKATSALEAISALVAVQGGEEESEMEGGRERWGCDDERTQHPCLMK